MSWRGIVQGEIINEDSKTYEITQETYIETDLTPKVTSRFGSFEIIVEDMNQNRLSDVKVVSKSSSPPSSIVISSQLVAVEF